MFSVKLINDTKFKAHSEKTLLESALLDQKVLTHSCRTGRCGVCIAPLLSGQTKVIKYEQSISKEALDAGYILTCCREACSDIVLGVEDVSILNQYPTKTLPCRIDALKSMSTNVLQVTLRLPPAMPLKYLPGQYIDVIGPDGLRRSYSIANVPNEKNKIKLDIRFVEKGLFSNYWFNDANINDLLRLEGPKGTFFHRESAKPNLVFLATGTGIAPIRAMLPQFQHTQLKYNITVYWGGRGKIDLYDDILSQNENINYVPVLSRPGSDWSGEQGYVQDVAINKHDWENTTVYACGSPQMIASAKSRLIEHGLDEHHFFSDAFVSSDTMETIS
ncbi:MAG: FAD-binding oxidoreductase [Pseudomonadota bacterium]|nr:FAD-binding oxidoreductase [Pseudomonadota bacterium]